MRGVGVTQAEKGLEFVYRLQREAKTGKGSETN